MSRREKQRPNLGDPGYQRKVRETDKLRRLQLDENIRKVLGTDEGRRVLMWIVYGVCALENGGIDALGDSLVHFTGRRWVGREVLAKCTEVSPGTISHAIAEEHWERAELARYKDAVETPASTEAVNEEDDNAD